MSTHPDYAIFDTTNFPTVIVSFTGSQANEENFSNYLIKTKSLYNDKRELAIIFDATDASLPGIKYQKMQAEWLKTNEALMKKYCKGTAYVISNKLVRAILTAIFKFQKQPVPYLIVPTITEAKSWSRDILKQ